MNPVTTAITTAPAPNCLQSTEQLALELAKLEALLFMTYGEARENFEAMNLRLRENYMAACADIASGCQRLIDVQLNECIKVASSAASTAYSAALDTQRQGA